ncbi:hypothetical protein [Wenyingzhuangia sp. 2_MG-2023]|uniref:hypothetical protein n=1 Tax=Wenyingzhuangia sp. 2_MG-2023 TaxID=3062639 RepID=UPI0026E44465|nr:hypothetical protein [Wenyingzhuangia sp. 2_MG-2023]MDO6738245.1 hypothetical protein [Wenyingzhuangia sp. 2_MG-2023]
MKKNITFIAFFLIGFCFYAQQKNKTDKNDIRAARISFITEKLSLRPNQAEKFWPVYNTYKNETYALIKAKNELQKNINFNSLSEQQAEQLFRVIIDKEQQIYDRAQEFHQDITKVIDYKQILKLRNAETNFKKKLLEHIQKKKN